jgi:hypothetical protein
MSEWKPIEEWTPKDGEVICYHPRIVHPYRGQTHGVVVRIGRPDDWPNRAATLWKPIGPLPSDTNRRDR